MTHSDDFQSLSDQYNSTLNQYKEVYKKYIHSLYSSEKNQSNHLDTVSDSSFWGSSELSTSQVSSVHDCMKSCSDNSSCSGATYNNNNQNCYLRKGNGNGNIIHSKSGETAIVPSSLRYSYELKGLNQQLLDTNQQMTDSLNHSYKKYKKNTHHHEKKQHLLNNNNDILQNDKQTIEEMIREQELLNAAGQNSEIVVTEEYSKYIVYLLVVILLFALLIKFSFSTTSQYGGGKQNKWFTQFFKL
jgi:hypothetical protein